MREKFRVLIVNSSHWPALARLPATLHQAGCQVDLLSPKGMLVAKSRFIHHHIVAPGTIHAVIDTLRSYLETLSTPYDWIISGDEPLLYGMMVRASQEPWLAEVFPVVPTGEASKFLFSKSAFPILGKHWGFPVPETTVCESEADVKKVALTLGYPLVLKNHVGFGGSSVVIVENMAGIPAALEKLKLHKHIIAQAFVAGEVCAATALYRRGELMAWMACRKVKAYPDEQSPMCRMESLSVPELEPVLERLGEKTGFHGLGGVDFIWDPANRQITLLEQHGRPTPHFYLGRWAGVDFPKAIRAMLSGGPALSPKCRFSRRPRQLSMFPKDIQHAIAHGDVKNMLQWLFFPTRWQQVMWEEPVILWSFIKMLWRQAKDRFYPATQPAPGLLANPPL